MSQVKSPKTPGVPKPASPWLSYAIDFGPLLVFFLVYRFAAPPGSPVTAAIYGTTAFMVAITIAVIVSQWLLGKIAPMLWISAALILGFGALTIYFNDPLFIQIKPTIIYSGFAAMLLGGWLSGRALLKYVFHAAFPGLSETGWVKLSRNWGLFFAGLAVMNEAMRLLLDFDWWLTLKVWAVTPLSLIFAVANVPMLLKHGLTLDDPDETKATDAEGKA